MQKWNYLIIHARHKSSIEDMEEELNLCGEQGWALVNTNLTGKKPQDGNDNPVTALMIFKRPISAASVVSAGKRDEDGNIQHFSL